MSSTGADGPFVEQQRLERAINWARWSGAVLVFLLGPFFANLGPGFILVLSIYLVAYGFFTRALFGGGSTFVVSISLEKEHA